MPAISPSPILLNYIIYTTNTALAAAWMAANPSGVLAGPDRLAASQGLTVNYAATALPDPSGCWFFPANDGGIFFPGDFVHFDKTVDSGFVDPNDLKTDYTTNWDPIEYKWWGIILPYYFTAPAGGSSLLARRWACGFELGGTGNAGLNNLNSACGPAGSRTTDGFGYTATPGGGGDLGKTTTPVGSGLLNSFCSWERFYFRPWVLPNQGELAIWSANDSLEGVTACFLAINTAGQLVFRNWGNSGSPGTVLGTSAALTLGAWVKLDLVVAWAQTGPTAGVMSLMINGVLAFSGSQAGGTSGLGTTNAKHTLSTIGPAQTVPVGGLSPTNQYRYDVDDWINVAMATPSLPATVDVLNGTHIRLVNVAGIAAAGAWTGDYRGLAGNTPGITPPNQIAATTASTQIIFNTDYVNLPQLGIASILVHCWPSTWPGGPAIVGYRLNGGAIIKNTNVGQAGAVNNWSGQIFQAGATPVTDVTTLDISLDKDASASSMGIAALFAAVEWIGVFGPEDVPAGSTPVKTPVRAGLHNAPYPEIDAVTFPLQSMAWASARSGTYVGNGTGQDIPVGVPFHWLWIRVVGTTNSDYWWSSQFAHHNALGGGFSGIDSRLPVVSPPSGAATVFRVSGSNAATNQVGVTYAWVAFSDPSSRFLLNGAVAWTPATASVANPLQDPAFTPTCVFTAQEDLSSGIAGFFYKGPGNATDTANPLTGADVAAVMTFGAGTLTTKAAAHYRTPQMAYAAWRTVDATGASGLIDCVSYTGDGLSSRNIAVNLGGNSPLFAFGIAHTLGSYFRDPAHTGLDSNAVTGGIVTTAIIGGGLNYVTVGALLNVLGRTYDIFVIAGAGFAGSWTPNLDGGGNPVTPPWLAPAPPLGGTTPPVLPPIIPPVPPPPHGWWQSDAGFRGDVVAIGDARPANPRSWKDFVGFAAGSAAMLGGSPGIAAIVRNHMIYAASNYVVGTDAPPIHIFDGSYDRQLATLPPSGAGPAHGVVSILVANGTIYVATWDSGTDSTTWLGRVFSLDIDSATLTPIGDVFPVGHLPYALASLNSQLWCGTHRQTAAAPGKIFSIRPGIDATWTEDHDLTAESLGGVAALAAFQGALYVGATAPAATFGQVLARAADGTYSVVDTGTGGAATANNGYLAFGLFLDALYAAYWNNDTPAIAKVRRSADGVTWTTAYSGAAGTLRPFLALPVDAGMLYAIGGGLGLTAAIVGTFDGVAWLNLTPQLPETDRTALPAVAVVVL